MSPRQLAYIDFLQHPEEAAQYELELKRWSAQHSKEKPASIMLRFVGARQD
jgi:hypothetical protein